MATFYTNPIEYLKRQMHTSLTDRLNISIPIVQAPMGGAAGPELAAAVSNAGGLGSLPVWTADLETTRSLIRETRSLTGQPFAVNLNMEFPQEDRLAVCLEEGAPVVSFFWQDSSKLVERTKAAGATVMHTVATSDEAKRAADSGVDILVAQGWEAGGHVRGNVATMALVPAIVDLAGDLPVVAAGGISDGRGIAAALCLGAGGAWIGTRFLSADEANIHPEYRARLIVADESDTTYVHDLFDVGWRNAPHRVLTNSTVHDWLAADRPESGQRPGERQVIGKVPGRDILRYMSHTPDSTTTGDVEAMSMWAGQGVGLVRSVQPAAEIVSELWSDARQIMERRI